MKTDPLIDEALVHLKNGRIDNAISILQGVLYQDAHHLDGCYLMGVALMQKKCFNEAEVYIKEALVHKPGDSLIATHLANIYRNKGEYHKALMLYGAILKQDPSCALAHLNLALTLEAIRDTAGAALSLRRYLSLNPFDHNAQESYMRLCLVNGTFQEACLHARTHTDMCEHEGFLLSFCEALERIGEVEEALSWSEKLLERSPNNIDALKLWCLCQRRLSHNKSVIKRLKDVDIASLPPEKARALHAELALAYDATSAYDKAMFHCIQQNESALRCVDTPLRKAYKEYDDRVRRIRTSLEHFHVPHTPRARKAALPFTFLVGFPRSGTTLLHHILDSHSSMHVIEEKPLLPPLRAFICEQVQGGAFLSYVDALPYLGGMQRKEARLQYERSLMNVMGDKKIEKIIINKLPLNIIHGPLISYIFPDHIFIFMMRHPCDVIISCYFQDFSLNAAMMNFLLLESTVDFYIRIMNIWIAYQKMFAPRVHVVVYEHLVEDMKKEIDPLLEDLDLRWECNMENFFEKARGKNIATPSYADVRLPIYTSSVGQWLHYRKHFEPYLEKLVPYIEMWEHCMRRGPHKRSAREHTPKN